MLVGAVGCGGRGVTAVRDPSNGGEPGGAEYFKAKCKSDIEDCANDAREQCGGAYTVVHRESHAGGLLADALPGPVTWYTVTFRCGAAAEEIASSAREDALAVFVMPQCQSDWMGRCGLLADKFEFGASIDATPLAIESASDRGASGGFMRLAARVCDERADRLSGSCLAEFRRSFVKALRTRYPQADDARLLSWCDKHPEDCVPSNAEKLRLLELDFLVAHDRAVFARFEQKTAAAIRQQRTDARRGSEQGQRAGEEESIRRTREQMVRDAVAQMNRR